MIENMKLLMEILVRNIYVHFKLDIYHIKKNRKIYLKISKILMV